jgi:hypothetical protein
MSFLSIMQRICLLSCSVCDHNDDNDDQDDDADDDSDYYSENIFIQQDEHQINGELMGWCAIYTYIHLLKLFIFLH